MRLTGMSRMAKGVREADQPELSADLEEMLEHLKWNLWHGKVERALEILDELAYALEVDDGSPEHRNDRTRRHGLYAEVKHARLRAVAGPRNDLGGGLVELGCTHDRGRYGSRRDRAFLRAFGRIIAERRAIDAEN